MNAREPIELRMNEHFFQSVKNAKGKMLHSQCWHILKITRAYTIFLEQIKFMIRGKPFCILNILNTYRCRCSPVEDPPIIASHSAQ